MKLKTLRVERRENGSLEVQLQLSTNPNELKENSRLLKHAGPAPALEAISGEASSYVDRVRTNLNVGNLALQGLPQKVTFRDELKPHITDTDVEEALSNLLRLAEPSNGFIRKVLRAVFEHYQVQEGGGKREGSHLRIATKADAKG